MALRNSVCTQAETLRDIEDTIERRRRAWKETTSKLIHSKIDELIKITHLKASVSRDTSFTNSNKVVFQILDKPSGITMTNGSSMISYLIKGASLHFQLHFTGSVSIYYYKPLLQDPQDPSEQGSETYMRLEPQDVDAHFIETLLEDFLAQCVSYETNGYFETLECEEGQLKTTC